MYNVRLSQFDFLFRSDSTRLFCVWISSQNLYLSAERSQKNSWKMPKVIKHQKLLLVGNSEK